MLFRSDGLQAGAGPGVQVIETVDVALGAGTQELGGLRRGDEDLLG